jgi:response regulator RpfG family c-di-GMP phosphodiesterase
VAQVAVMMAEAAKLPIEETEQIKVAALLHDIGKIGMEERLLRMEVTRMDPCELAQYHRHAQLGQSAIDSIETMRPAGVLIRHHHENYDGSGFPDGLKGTDIPLGSRIIAMADCFDLAFAANRADNAIEVILRMMKGEQGTKFDPALFPLLEDPVRKIYAKLLQKSSMVEMELHPGDLREGMIIAREVRSGTGLLLLGAGENLDAGKIHSLKRYYLIDPPANSETVTVYARS